jgi:glycosyltransferase involved in cell wall biosynthesis
MNSSVYIVDARHRINKIEQETISRHIKYAVNLEEISDGMCKKITIIQVQKKNEHKYESLATNLDVIRLHGVFGFISKRQLVNAINKSTNSKSLIFVAGDPLISGFMAIRLRDWFNKKQEKFAKVQIQTHFELNSINRRISFQSLIRYYLTKYALKNADQLRFVGPSQRSSFVQKFDITQPSLVVPVPLNISSDYSVVPRKLFPETVAFVGRLHSERGLLEFIQIAVMIFKFKPNIKILIYGDGPEKGKLEKIIQGLPIKNEIIMKGNLANLDSEWANIGVLVSTAPAESYGRAMREAHIHGVPVLAVQSQGAKQLHGIAPEGSIILLPRQFTDSDVKNSYESLKHFVIPMSYREQLLEMQMDLSKQIPASWVDLIGMD